MQKQPFYYYLYFVFLDICYTFALKIQQIENKLSAFSHKHNEETR
ncbi:hypothetical protein HMPREF9419_2186 [Prevotella nigrescens ATCC 33563]|nr:hypothetical protein HMPREF9419_2186 [Prevotella nigrescens ATCC 33563]